jgi:dipeptidyl aminopeptidase/acylaminoacyl peptidase
VLTWTSSDSEIVFSVAPPVASALRAFRVSDGTERTIDSGKPYPAAAPAPAGDELYYAGDVSPSGEIRDVRLFEASSGRELTAMDGASAFAVSPDGQRIAFARGRASIGVPVRVTAQTFILNLADLGLSQVVPCRIPLRFSPDGARLLCQTGKYEYAVEPAIVDLANGTASFLPERFGTSDLAWTSSGLRAVYRSESSAVEVVAENATTGERTLIKTDGVRGTIVTRPIWSPDGTRVAFAKEECEDSEPVCERRVRLVVADVGRGTSAVIAVGYDGLGAVAFSHDAHRLAYVLDGALRLRDLPY